MGRKSEPSEGNRPVNRWLGLAALVACLALAGCGGSGDGGGSLVFLGASSLQEAGTEYAESFAAAEGAEVRTSFAGSDELAAQIKQGAKADVYAAASTDYPEELFAEGLVEKPVVFAQNELVIAVPAGSEIESIGQLAEAGTKIVVGAPSVPVGSYTQTVLDKLPAEERNAVRGNIRSEEPEVSSVVAKLEQGAADAGFVYVTDAQSAGDKLKTVAIPANLQPAVAYAAAVVKGSGDEELARKFLDGLLQGEGAEDLRRAGFLPPP